MKFLIAHLIEVHLIENEDLFFEKIEENEVHLIENEDLFFENIEEKKIFIRSCEIA